MKKLFITVFILQTTISCITIKQAPEIDDYVVRSGKEFQKKNFTNQTAFIFQNDLKMVDFRSFLADKFNMVSFKDTATIPVTIDGTPFELHVFTPTKNKKNINFINALINKDADEITIDEEIYDYVGISVSRVDDLDCLSENSIYHKLVLNYLINLKDEYFEL